MKKSKMTEYQRNRRRSGAAVQTSFVSNDLAIIHRALELYQEVLLSQVREADEGDRDLEQMTYERCVRITDRIEQWL